MKTPASIKIPFVLFLALYFLYLVAANAPAGWAAWIAQKAVPGLWMGSVQGNIWQGEAGTAQFDVPGQEPLPLGKLTWKLSPWSLLILKPCLNFTSSLPGQNINGKVCQSISGTSSVKNLNIDAPIARFNAYTPLDMGGDVSIQILSAAIASDGAVKNLNAKYSWQRATAFFEGSWLTLGSFAGTARENGRGGLLAEAFDLEGPYKLALDGELQDLKKGIELQGTITPQENASSIIVEGLKILGEDLGNGSYKVQWP